MNPSEAQEIGKVEPTINISSRGPKRKRSIGVVAGGVAGAVLVAGIVVLLAGLAPPSGLPSSVSLPAFEQTIKADITAPTSRGGFGVPGVASVTCVMPSSWKPGKTFACFAFRSGDIELGSVRGVVRPTTPGKPWNAELDWNGGA
jgi:hypothetical protein